MTARKPKPVKAWAFRERGIFELYGNPVWLAAGPHTALLQAKNWEKRIGIHLVVVRVEIRIVK